MKPIVVADTGPLIALSRLGRLELLTTLFSEVHIPWVVLSEATGKGEYTDAKAIRSFTKTYAHLGASIENALSRRLHNILDEGETQALVMAKELDCGVLMDEKRGRLVARHQGIPVVGVLGVLLQAKHEGHLSELTPLVSSLQDSGYRLSEDLVKTVLELSGES